MNLEEKTGRSYVSHSGLSTWLNCGWQFYLSRVQRVPENPSYWLTGGSAVHEATEAYDRWQMGQTDGYVFDATVEFNEAWDRLFERANNGMTWRSGGRASKAYPNGEDESWWRAEGPKMVGKYIQFREESPYQIALVTGGVPAIELEMNQTVHGVPVKAILDRIFVNDKGEAIIVDIKTGSREPIAKTQMGIYAVMCEKTFGIRPTKGAYYMARTGALTPEFDLSLYTEQRLGSWVSNFAKAVEHDIYIPSPGFLCGTCGVNNACYVVNGKDSHKYPELIKENDGE